MPTDTAHGTRKRAVQHRNEGTRLCAACVAGEADYHGAWRIRSGKKKALAVPVDSARRILAGEDPAVVLAETFGPLTMDVVRRHGQVSRG